MSQAMPEPGQAAPEWAGLVPLFREIGDLKRLRTPELVPSISAAAFATFARRAFAGDEDWTALAHIATAQSVAATRLAGIRPADLTGAGLNAPAVAEVFERALATHRPVIAPGLFADLAAAPLETLAADS